MILWNPHLEQNVTFAKSETRRLNYLSGVANYFIYMHLIIFQDLMFCHLKKVLIQELGYRPRSTSWRGSRSTWCEGCASIRSPEDFSTSEKTFPKSPVCIRWFVCFATLKKKWLTISAIQPRSSSWRWSPTTCSEEFLPEDFSTSEKTIPADLPPFRRQRRLDKLEPMKKNLERPLSKLADHEVPRPEITSSSTLKDQC